MTIYKYLLVLILSFVALSGCEQQTGNDVSSTVTVAQWGQEKYLIYLPFYIAQEQGFFAEKGINIVLEYSGNDDQVFAKVLRGDASFGIGDPIFTAVSRQRGSDGVVIASIVDRVALWGVSKQNKPLLSPIDFNGLKIGTFPRPSTAYTLLTDTLNEAGISNGSILEIPIGNELALLENNQADLVMLLEPAASIAESKGFNVVTSFPKLWGQFAFTGLTSTETIVKRNPQLAEDMKNALQQAVDFAHSDLDGTLEIAKKLFPNLSENVLRNSVTRMLEDETIPTDVSISEDAWNASIKTRQKVGDVQKDFKCPKCLYKPR